MDILTYILSKRYIEDSLKGVGALKGKSAYEIACDNGFKGSLEEWLDSLKGETPRISDDGTWVIGEVDTGILASPDLFGYATEDYVNESVKVVGEALAEKVDKDDAIPVPTIAAVGQTVMVKAVDENGKPTEWEAVDKPVYIANVRVDRGRYSFIDGSYETLLNAYNSGATVGLNVGSYMYYLHHIDGDNNLHFGQIPHRSIGSDHSTSNYNLMIALDNSFTQIQMDIATEQFVRNELEKIEVSGGGGVSSWNDLTDKPFYDANGSEKILPDRLPNGGVGWEGPGGKTDILPESNLVVDENTQTTPMPDGRILYGYLFLSPTIKADLTEGAEYDIAINGVVYRRVCTAPGGPDDPIHGLGNLALGEMGEDTGEDWLFYAYAGEPGFFVGVFATTNAEYKTVAVSTEGTLIHPIEDRFIPASVARKGDVNWQAIPDKPFGVTVVNLASPMTLAEMRYDGSYTAGLGFLPQRIAAGERYLVSVDGEITEWVAQQGDSGVYLGEDPRAFNEADPLPEGAYSIWQTSNSILVYLLGDRTAPIIGVAHVEIKYIDERVIPEGIARKTDIPVVPVTSVNGMTGDVVIEIELDTTLTVEGKAADAKAVGDVISKISGQNLSLDTTLTQSGKAADAAAVGAALDELDEKIPTKPEDIGAQPKGDYLTAVPAGYATEEFVKNKIAEAELGGEEVDLSDYAQKSELPTKVSQLENDKGYLTAVPDGYAKTEDIPKKPADIGAQPAGNYLTSIPEEYITESELDSKGYLTDFTESDPTVPAWAKEPSKPTYTASEVGALPNTTVIPDSLADLNEDANHRLVTDTEKSTWNAKSNFSGSYDDLTNKPAIPSIAGLASTTYVDNAVKNKVDKDGNKVLSTNDYTTAEKNKLANIAAGAEVNVNADWNATSGDAQILNKPTLGSMAAKSSVAKSDLASGVQTSLGKADSALQPGDISNWAMQASKPAYTASEVGADPKGTAAGAVAEHNTAADAHNDIRVKLEELRQTLAHFFNATTPETMDQISELVSGIEANADLIAALTTGKVSVSSIVANLTTNLADRPLAASMGVELKKLIDQVSASLANYQPKGNYALASAVPTKVSQLTNDKGYLTEHQDISGKADKFDPTVYGLPVLRLTGDTAPIAVSKDNKVTVDYAWGERSGTAKLKGQGATSYKIAQALVQAGKAGKFNYTITFDEAFEAFPGWGMQKKYCLKANWIDPTQSRNICSCKQWGMIVKSRRNVPAELANLPNGGAIDGFPVVIMLNGEFHGLYTWNIPKDGWMFGLVEDATKTQAVVGANDHELATQFKGELAGDESDFELEFVSDKTNTAWVATSLNRLINACINSTGADLDTVVGQYIDWDSAIDYLIHIVVDKATDCVDKNFLLVTFNGTKWYFSDYDRDSIWGLNWDGSGLSRPVNGVDFAHCRSVSRLWELILRFKTDRFKERYWELRKTVLAESKIMQTVENFAWAIPAPVMQEDVKLYPTIPGSSVNTIDQIGRFVRQRLETVDAWVDELPAQEEPVEPDAPLKGNLVPTAIDTDGSIYNGTGYKDNTRLSSSGGVSGTAQDGSVVTGFIEFRPTDVIRMKGAEWLNATANYQGHYYLNFYDSDKAFISGGTVSSSEYAKTDSVYPVNINIMYDEATDVTTFDIVEGEWFAGLISNAAYFRINAYGKGEDLVITVNEEIV